MQCLLVTASLQHQQEEDILCHLACVACNKLSDSIMQSHMGPNCCPVYACYLCTSSPDSPTHVNKACHLLSPVFVPSGHSCCKKTDLTIFRTSVQSSKMATDSATSVCIAHANGKSLICQVTCLNTIALHLILPFVVSYTMLCLSRYSSLHFVLIYSLSYLHKWHISLHSQYKITRAHFCCILLVFAVPSFRLQLFSGYTKLSCLNLPAPCSACSLTTVSSCPCPFHAPPCHVNKSESTPVTNPVSSHTF